MAEYKRLYKAIGNGDVNAGEHIAEMILLHLDASRDKHKKFAANIVTGADTVLGKAHHLYLAAQCEGEQVAKQKALELIAEAVRFVNEEYK